MIGLSYDSTRKSWLVLDLPGRSGAAEVTARPLSGTSAEGEGGLGRRPRERRYGIGC